MKALSHTQTSTLQMPLNRGADLISRVAGSMKPKHRADQIAAIVAASNNPSGA